MDPEHFFPRHNSSESAEPEILSCGKLEHAASTSPELGGDRSQLLSRGITLSKSGDPEILSCDFF